MFHKVFTKNIFSRCSMVVQLLTFYGSVVYIPTPHYICFIRILIELYNNENVIFYCWLMTKANHGVVAGMWTTTSFRDFGFGSGRYFRYSDSKCTLLGSRESTWTVSHKDASLWRRMKTENNTTAHIIKYKMFDPMDSVDKVAVKIDNELGKRKSLKESV